MTKTYPYTDEHGDTVWACCESSIGPSCQHREPPVDTDKRESLRRCLTHAAIVHAQQAEQHVVWALDDGDIREGIVRHGSWLADGALASYRVDPRDACLRVTMRSGLEAFLPWALFVELYEAENLRFSDR